VQAIWRVVVGGLADSAGFRSVHSHRCARAGPKPSLTWEPVSGFEPLACRLQEVRPRAPYVLAAPIAQVIALTALAALRLSDTTFHEPFHARGRQRSLAVTMRSVGGPSPCNAQL
jgi:hypothetical protein